MRQQNVEKFPGYEDSSMVYFVRYLVFLFLLVGTSDCRSSEPAAQPAGDMFDKACQLVYEGNFDSATEIISKHPDDNISDYNQLIDITNQYAKLQQSRRKAKKEQYEKKLNKLKALRWGDDVNDINDVNSPADIFSVTAALIEYADEEQKAKALALPIVNEAVNKAKAAAADYESKGKWLDAYTSCYYWLSILYKDNKEYKDHADELLERAEIVGSFKNSPCQTSQERFKKIKPEMFKTAIEIIDRNYVEPKFLDYSKMAQKALNRCELLAEVVNVSYDEIKASQDSNSVQTNGQILFKPNDESLKAWSAAINSLKQEVQQSKDSISRNKLIEIFDDVLKFNSTTVVLPESLVIAHFTEASFSVLDPHTVLVWPSASDDFRKDLTGEFAGIGILITREKGFLTAASLLPDTPAYLSGLDAGDIIEQVNGEPTKDMTLSCAVKMITGPVGTDVTLTVRTPGQNKSRQLVITRSRIKVHTIRGWQRTSDGQWKYFIDEKNKIACIRIYDKFAEATSSELEVVLDKLEAQGLKGLILDLRYNPGGLLDSAVDIIDKFIDKGLIVRTQPRWGIPDYRIGKSKGTHPQYPIVVLVNGGSASASEIVAGALQDKKYKRAVIVGQRTYGKGSVQTISYRVGAGAMLKYTMGYYHLPSGQRVNSREDMEKLDRDDWGITPDVEVKLTPAELSKMLDIQKDNDVLVKADHDSESTPLNKHSIKETIESDPQLAVGILIIKTKLLEQHRVLTAMSR